MSKLIEQNRAAQQVASDNITRLWNDDLQTVCDCLPSYSNNNNMVSEITNSF